MAEKKDFWRKEWGEPYALETKKGSIALLLKDMEHENKIGDVCIDVGSGALWQRNLSGSGTMWESYRKIVAQFFPERVGRKIIRIDKGASKTKVLGDKIARASRVWVSQILRIKANVEADDLEQELEKHVPEFLGKKKWKATTLLFCDILNYVDYKKVITRMSKLLEPGGRIVIHNCAGTGYFKVFSENKMTDPNKAKAFLEDNGFHIEHFAETNVPFGQVHTDVKENTIVHIVARKLPIE